MEHSYFKGQVKVGTCHAGAKGDGSCTIVLELSQEGAGTGGRQSWGCARGADENGQGAGKGKKAEILCVPQGVMGLSGWLEEEDKVPSPIHPCAICVSFS